MQAIENESRSMDRAERLAAESDTVVLVVGWGAGDRCFFFFSEHYFIFQGNGTAMEFGRDLI